MNQLEQVREKVIEAVPELLKPGAGDARYWITLSDGTGVQARNIRLSDVLVAMNLGEFDTPEWAEKEAGEVHTLCLLWNLRADSLDEQSEETIAFLHKILV